MTFHLEKLQDLRFVERRLPVTLSPDQQRRSKRGRYHLSDPFFRFYFRFIQPHLNSLLTTDQTTSQIRKALRGYVGMAFEQLSQEWLADQAKAGKLDFMPLAIGSHWSRKVQIDVVAINHETREMLIGECKWGKGSVSSAIVQDLLEIKTGKLRAELREGASWKIQHAIFARAGLTEAAAESLAAVNGLLVTPERFDSG